MTFLSKICHLVLLLSCASALIIPEELPSILSVIYSNIPPIRKGTDSRVGVGFRFGEHADFQVLLELGPQTNTQPLGPDGDSKTRRQIQRPLPRPSYNTDTVADTPGGKWLSSWKSGFVNPEITKLSSTGVHQIIQDPMIGKKDVKLHLQQLYKKSQESSSRNINNETENSEIQTKEASNSTAPLTTDSTNSTSTETVTEKSS